MSMLDDFVEHSGGPSIPPRQSSNAAYRNAPLGGSGISDVEFEGFEADDEADRTDEDGMVQALETGFIPSARITNASLPALFSLSLVQYTPPSSILSLVAGNSLLFLAADPLSIIIIDLNRPDELVTVDLPRPAPEKGSNAPQKSPKINALFVDPTARHLLITTTSSDTFYLPISPGNAAVQSRRPRPLRLRQAITAVAWSPLSSESQSDNATNGDANVGKSDAVTPPATDVLLGTSTGQILSLPLPPQDDIFKSVSISMSKPTERDLQVVYTLPDQKVVSGLAFGFWRSSETNAPSSRRRAWAVVTTDDRLYQLQADVSINQGSGRGATWPEELFRSYRDRVPNFHELPGIGVDSHLRLYVPPSKGKQSLWVPTSLAWLSGPGLYVSPVSITQSADILTRSSLIPYPPSQAPSNDRPGFARKATDKDFSPPTPLGGAVTDWHWLLLYQDQLIGISRESEKEVYRERLPLNANEKVMGLTADPVSRTYWISTDKSILEVLVQAEDRDVWRLKLDRGDFTEAARHAKTPAQRDVILSKQGDALFEEGRFIQAAQCYAKSSRSFEYVTLRFSDADERDALRIYLSDRLDLLNKQDRTQRMMLATWLVEIFLSKCNMLEDVVAAESATSDVESLNVERQMMEEDMRNFIRTYQSDLEPKVIYDLILSHGRTDLYLFYASLLKDNGRILEHWISEEQWSKAIDVLNRQNSLDLYYRHASILIRHAPVQVVDAWCRRSDLSPRRLIPALLQYKRPPDTEITSDQAVRYLNHVVFDQQSTETTVFNLLITLYATDPSPNDEPLLHFLATCPENPASERPYYDLDYALRICQQHSRIHACVLIYSKLGQYESSVELALERGDLELAKVNADRPEGDDVLRKKLWLKVAKYVVQEKKDIKSAMKFLESTDLVKIEDILPFFPDFVIIDDFKAEICSALEEYSSKIDELKAEMDEATASADSIKRDIEALSNRFVTIEPEDKCWKCGVNLTSRQFYVFPCQHTFHADCSITMAMEYLPAPTLRRILHLQNVVLGQNTSKSRALLSSQPPRLHTGDHGATTGNAAPQDGPTSGSATADLLFGVSGRNKLFAAGDKLRELIVPDAIVQAVSGGFVGSRKTKRDSAHERSRAEEARKELDDLVAGVCPLCEGSVVGLDKPFINPGEEVSDWKI